MGSATGAANSTTNGAANGSTVLLAYAQGERKFQSLSLATARWAGANLGEADLQGANLQGADLGGANLKQACLAYAQMDQVDGRGVVLTAANLEQACLKGANLDRAVLSGADLREADLRNANLQRANLSGANLRGANLRWADLSGANLRWADLTETKLSGATLIGADLSNAILNGASLIHADLTQANLMRVEWAGVDLSEATLTGAKLYDTPRFGIKAQNALCDWVDLSAGGDRTQVHSLTPTQLQSFFRPAIPQITIDIDGPLNPQDSVLLLNFYQQLIQRCRLLYHHPPSLTISRRRTLLSFDLHQEARLLAIAYFAIQPFRDAPDAQAQLQDICQRLKSNAPNLPTPRQNFIHQTTRWLEPMVGKLPHLPPDVIGPMSLFSAPTELRLHNSMGQILPTYRNPQFGKRIVNISSTITRSAGLPAEDRRAAQMSDTRVLEFFQGVETGA